MFTVKLSPIAARGFKKLPAKRKEAMGAALRGLREQPRKGPKIRKLKGFDATSRLRVGSYRAVYELEVDDERVYVTFIGPRGEAPYD